MEPGDVVAFVRQIGSALAEVHRLGIVHRDLKPENLIRTGERWVIIDFGTAGLRAGGASLAATTLVSGSLAYMAPEQLTGHYSPASDVYSFGLLILEALTSKRLSEMQRISSEEGFTAELETILAAVVSRPEGAHGLAYLLSEAFRPEPARRPADADGWAREVAELIERSQPVRHPA
jgi:serine/threonine protein kinase